MSPSDETGYYERRAEDQINLAQKAVNSRAVQAHYEIASAYLDRIYGSAPNGPDRMPSV